MISEISLELRASLSRLNGFRPKLRTRRSRLSILFAATSLFAIVLFCALRTGTPVLAEKRGETEDPISSAVFGTAEFFGAKALVPLPAKEALANLARLISGDPDNADLYLKRAEIFEQERDYDSAEKAFIAARTADSSAADKLIGFYERRGRFADASDEIEKLFFSAGDDNARTARLRELFHAARRHKLAKYLNAEFYRRAAAAVNGAFPVYEEVIDAFLEDGDNSGAIDFIRDGKKLFPGHSTELLGREISLLQSMGKGKEAERIYVEAFDPFWSTEESDAFYDFLSGRDRLREYGSELEQAFKQTPDDYDAAMRLAHYRTFNYQEAAPVISELESRKKTWTGDELLGAARVLLKDGEGELASRFLYTLFQRGDFQKNKDLRGRVLYQLFEVFSDQGNSRLSLAGSGLGLYSDIARSDPNPGISSGVLSLLFADTAPRKEFSEKQRMADGEFNRAAAYRLFSEYRKEFEMSPHLAQMYLDLIRLYTVNQQEEIAYGLLSEFEQRHENTSDYPGTALRLAEAFEARGDTDRAAAISLKVLDHTAARSGDYLGPASKGFGGIRAQALAVSDPDVWRSVEFGGETPRDTLGVDRQKIDYRFVLGRIVDLYSTKKETLKILELYSREISKHPEIEWLYEQRLSWLEQTTLLDEEASLYKAAADRFKTNEWRQKLARFLLRQGRKRELGEYSKQLAANLNDEEVQQFISGLEGSATDEGDFKKALLEELYVSALKRFPSNSALASGLLGYYAREKDEAKWMNLAARHFFVSETIRDQFLSQLEKKGMLRDYLSRSKEDSPVYRLFRAEATSRISEFETSYPLFAGLAAEYPGQSEFTAKAKDLARSLGQRDRSLLATAGELAESIAERDLSSSGPMIEAGEIRAELGDFEAASRNWEAVIGTAAGTREAYLETATVFWDYFQFARARTTLEKIRRIENDESLYAFERGAILESEKDLPAAVREYVKALDTRLHDGEQASNSQKRLAALARRNDATANLISAAFQRERSGRRDTGPITLAYAEVLSKMGNDDDSKALLNAEIRNSSDIDFLKSTLDHYGWLEDASGRQVVYRRLTEVSESPRAVIHYHLKLADSLRESRDPEGAKAVMASLVTKFPTNYGVVSEAADFYRYTGFDSLAARTLSDALLRARGKYRLVLAQKLAKTEVELGRLDEAAELLERLHAENDHDPVIFRALATVLVRQKRPAELRKAFDVTVRSLRGGDRERIDVRQQVYNLRREMVEAFTVLGDPASAIDQYIEIINRNPEDTGQLTDDAIAYAKRYGVTERLLAYYKKLSRESYKNFRWNLVLSKLYEAGGDLENATKNLSDAIGNSPDDPELHLHLAELELRRGKPETALGSLDRTIELSGNQPELVKKKIALLEKLGRKDAAAEARKLLPRPEKPENLFDEAARAENAELALDLYQKAFDKLMSDPARSELRPGDLGGYAKAVRDARSLSDANASIWKLRDKLVSIAETKDSAQAGAARERIRSVDAVLVNSIGNIARERADTSELYGLYQFLDKRLSGLTAGQDKNGTITAILDVGTRAGFGTLEEKILRARVVRTGSDTGKQNAIRELGEFYEGRGAFEKLAYCYREFGFKDLSAQARAARLAGQPTEELEILAKIYSAADITPSTSASPDVSRYLELLYKNDRKELASVASRSSHYQIQLINFLLGKGERSLVHRAIDSSSMPEAWKLARNAEASLALKEFGEDAECYFCSALKFGTVGEMISQKPDKKEFLINDDWYRLTGEYGEWLEKSAARDGDPHLYLAAMIENRPADASEQFRLGARYLSSGDIKRAILHLLPAREMAPNTALYGSYLGAAYFRGGQTAKAKEIWTSIGVRTDLNNAEGYLTGLKGAGLNEMAIAEASHLLPVFLAKASDDPASLGALVRAIAEILPDGRSRTEFFERICRMSPHSKTLLNLLLNDSLIDEADKPLFLKMLVETGDPIQDYDYRFVSSSKRIGGTQEDSEAAYDQELGFEAVEEPSTDRFVAQRQLFELFAAQHRTKEARETAASISKELSRRYARPAWLRLGSIGLDIADGRYDPRDAERFVGIDAGPSPFVEPQAPNLERLNSVLRLLRRYGNEVEAARLRKEFYARTLAVGSYEQGAFAGLARAMFALNETEEGLKLLGIFTDVFDPDLSNEALRKLESLAPVKRRMPLNVSPGSRIATGPEQRLLALETAAVIADEFEKTEAALRFRRTLMAENPIDSGNKVRLGEVLTKSGDPSRAAGLWKEVAGDRFALRPVRWTALADLIRSGRKPAWSVSPYDPYSMQLAGSLNASRGDTAKAIENYGGALLADPDSQRGTRADLAALLLRDGRFDAGLRLAADIKGNCPAELCHLLSGAAEAVGDLAKAIDFERRSEKPDAERIRALEKAQRSKDLLFTEFKVDLENTRKQ